MKILMFGWEFPPHISGGLGTACHGLVKGLSACGGTEVTFVLPKLFGNEEHGFARVIGADRFHTRESVCGIAGNTGLSRIVGGDMHAQDISASLKVIEVDSFLLPYVSDPEFSLLQKNRPESGAGVTGTPKASGFPSADGSGSLMHEVARYADSVDGILLEVGDVDLIHAHDWLSFMAGIRAKEKTGKKLVVHIHSTEFDRSGQVINRNIYEVERLGMERADRVIVVSEFTRRIIIERYGIDARKISVIHNASEPAGQAFVSGSRKSAAVVVSFIGRITYQKGPRYFVEAAYKAREKGVRARYVMAGAGDQLSSIKSLVASLGMEEEFHFPGFLSSEEVKSLLADTDVYVMPSVSEPFGISALEAVNAGVPVIVSKNSGVSELITSLIKVDPRDTEAIANGIMCLSTDHEYAKNVAANAKKEAESVSWLKSAKELSALYKEVAAA